MDWKEAIAKLKKLDAEGVADLVSVVESKIGDLEADKFSIIGEKRNATTKSTALETALMSVARAIGIEGDIDAVLGAIEPKIGELKTAQTKLTEAEAAKTAAETKVASFERKGKLADIATKAGASAAVLETLFGDKLDQLAIDGETVKFGDKSLREHVEADAVLKDFTASLFPTGSTQAATADSKPQPKLPSGSPKGEAPAVDAIANHLKSRYGGWKAIKP